jgi:hypothetical protein
VSDAVSGSAVATIFLRGGESCERDLPLGSYQVRYATGTEWHGDELLFGHDTQYFQADKTFAFARIGDQLQGYTLELTARINGNLHTTKVSAKEW